MLSPSVDRCKSEHISTLIADSMCCEFQNSHRVQELSMQLLLEEMIILKNYVFIALNGSILLA